MNILIISLPRTGSSELGKKLSIKNKLDYKFEPFNPLNENYENSDLKNSVVKTIIFHKPKYISEHNRLNWLIDLTKNFEKIILLSRKDLIACAESWSYLNHKMKTSNFTSILPYLWEKTPNYEIEYENIKKWDNELNYISKSINIPITYYEDIYDLNNIDRLRKGNKTDYKTKLI